MSARSGHMWVGYYWDESYSIYAVTHEQTFSNYGDVNVCLVESVEIDHIFIWAIVELKYHVDFNKVCNMSLCEAVLDTVIIVAIDYSPLQQ